MQYESVVSKFGLSEKVFKIVTDSASANVKAFKETYEGRELEAARIQAYNAFQDEETRRAAARPVDPTMELIAHLIEQEKEEGVRRRQQERAERRRQQQQLAVDEINAEIAVINAPSGSARVTIGTRERVLDFLDESSEEEDESENEEPAPNSPPALPESIDISSESNKSADSVETNTSESENVFNYLEPGRLNYKIIFSTKRICI
jgi:hypothetical protein